MILNIKYTGYDTYKKIIDYHNNCNYPGDKYTFIHLDIFKNKDMIKNSELIILKDILMHWKLQNIYDFMDYLIENKKSKYILIINDSNQIKDNTDISINSFSDIFTNSFRPLSVNFLPLKKYNPIIIYKYQPSDKEVSLIQLY